jgi:segregation and condensation protein A
MAIPVKLQVFEGPLDLLLHLIEKNKIDIYDIPIVEITAQYLEYIKQMKEENMDICSEFLVMAATLLDIKCKMLLPVEENEEGEPEDPRAELVQQLLEYKMARQLSLELRDRQMMASQVLYRTRSILPDEVKTYEAPVDYDELRGDMTLPKLHEIFKSMLMRQEDRIDPIRSQYGKIEKEEIDMDMKTLFVQAYAREHRTFSFRKLLERQRSRAELIVTFLIILEMMKSGEITVQQEDINDDIMITSNVGNGNYHDDSGDDDDDADAKEAEARAKAEEFAEIVEETDHDDPF